MSIKIGAIVSVVGIALLALLYILPLIVTPLYWFVVAVLVTAAAVAVAYGAVVLLIAFEKYMSIRADRVAKQYQARVISTEHGTWFISHEHIDISPLSNTPYLRINGHERELTPDERLYMTLINAPKQAGQPLALPAPTNEVIPELMTILKDAQRVLIKAVSNGGKTTLLQHIADTRRKSEAVLILDSQSYPDKWPERCRVIGAGSNHPAISEALDSLIALMDQRYGEIARGEVREGQHPKLTVIIDEWMAIVDQCANAGDVIRRLLTESRKAAFSIFIGSHSERVKALGLDGRGDLRDGFLVVRIEVENNQHTATYDYGRGERPCLLPGRYISTETPPEFPELREPEAQIVSCPVCGKPVTGKSTYCSPACRQKAYRERVTV